MTMTRYWKNPRGDQWKMKPNGEWWKKRNGKKHWVQTFGMNTDKAAAHVANDGWQETTDPNWSNKKPFPTPREAVLQDQIDQMERDRTAGGYIYGLREVANRVQIPQGELRNRLVMNKWLMRGDDGKYHLSNNVVAAGYGYNVYGGGAYYFTEKAVNRFIRDK
ncbi:hypothetical protein ACOXBD_000166 [Escherichia coli]